MTSASTSPPRSRIRRLGRSPWTHLAAAVLALALLQGFVIKLYQVPSASMQPTLVEGDRILVSRLAYTGAAPGVGDVVVFAKPETWGPRSEHGVLRTAAGWFGDLTGIGPSNTDALVKRIAGTPGTTVACCNAAGAVTVDDAPLDDTAAAVENPAFEPGVLDCATEPRSLRCFPAITVPDDSYLVLGDNRGNSSDSVAHCRTATTTPPATCARFVPRDDIVGKVAAVLLPFDRAFSPLGGDR